MLTMWAMYAPASCDENARAGRRSLQGNGSCMLSPTQLTNFPSKCDTPPPEQVAVHAVLPGPPWAHCAHPLPRSARVGASGELR